MVPDEIQTAWQYIVFLHKKMGGFFSVERPGQIASTSEIRRWLNQRAVQINEEYPSAEENIDFPIRSLILFPKSNKRRCTLL